MKPSEALTILSQAGSELSKKSATALACLIAEYEAGKIREKNVERAVHLITKDLEAVEKVINGWKSRNEANLQNFLNKGEGV